MQEIFSQESTKAVIAPERNTYFIFRSSINKAIIPKEDYNPNKPVPQQ
jgi:hypothetical protein